MKPGQTRPTVIKTPAARIPLAGFRRGCLVLSPRRQPVPLRVGLERFTEEARHLAKESGSPGWLGVAAAVEAALDASQGGRP